MIERHQDPGGAEAALERMVAPEGVLQNVESVGSGRQTLHGADVTSIDLHGEREAGTRDHSVHRHRTGTADTMFASDVSARGADLLTQKIRQQHAGFGFAVDEHAVQLESEPVPLV
jgi:hypothetical protein